jgi:hypothetical protein
MNNIENLLLTIFLELMLIFFVLVDIAEKI